VKVASAELSQETLEEFLGQMQLIRAFDTEVIELFNRKLIRGSAHPYIGMEAIAVGVCHALGETDYITSTHRGHGHCIARGLDPAKMMAEILGRDTGYCGGKGGSMHITAMEHGMLGADAIVGGSLALAVGAACGARLQGRDSVVVCFFGDGAANEGSFHEACNLAAILDAGVVFVCENNRWAMTTPISSVMRNEDIADRAAGYGFPGFVVDGNDVVAMHEAAAAAVRRAREGEGPTLIEAKTYRMTPHSAFATGVTSTAEELETWRQRDPIDRLVGRLTAEYGVSADRIAEIAQEALAEVERATAFALDSEPPVAETATADVYAPADWLRAGRLA
jgi:TPP-dependent pyruvate/acetoin dehydrogenase alpha subunit